VTVRTSRALVTGGISGLMGTAMLFALRAFDRRYAPLTIAEVDDPRTDRTLWFRVGAGTVGGAVYGIVRGRRAHAGSLTDGVALGLSAYLLDWLVHRSPRAFTRAAKPVFPEIAGSLMRHLAFGMTTTVMCALLSVCARRSCRSSETPT
jgi:hypothetical protein